jgi:hypothetical protein
VFAGGALVCAKAPVAADNASAKTALAVTPGEDLRRDRVKVSADTGYPPVKFSAQEDQSSTAGTM